MHTQIYIYIHRAQHSATPFHTPCIYVYICEVLTLLALLAHHSAAPKPHSLYIYVYVFEDAYIVALV